MIEGRFPQSPDKAILDGYMLQGLGDGGRHSKGEFVMDGLGESTEHQHECNQVTKLIHTSCV